MVEDCDNAIDQGGWKTEWSIHFMNIAFPWKHVEIRATLVEGGTRVFHLCGDISRRRNKDLSCAWSVVESYTCRISSDRKHVNRLITHWRGMFWGLQKETAPAGCALFHYFFYTSLSFLPQTDNINLLYIICSSWHLDVSTCSQWAYPVYEAIHCTPVLLHYRP